MSFRGQIVAARERADTRCRLKLAFLSRVIGGCSDESFVSVFVLVSSGA